MRYEVEYCPNPDAAVVHVDVTLPKKITGPPPQFGPQYTAEDRGFLFAIQAVPGVASASFYDTYKCQVYKGRLFRWEDVIAGVVKVLESRYGPAVPGDDVVS